MFIQDVFSQVSLDSLQTNLGRYSKGVKNLNTLDEKAFQNSVDNLFEIAPELSDYIVAFGYGDSYEKGSLSNWD